MTGQSIILGLIQGLTEFFPFPLLLILFFFARYSIWENKACGLMCCSMEEPGLRVLIYLIPYYSQTFRQPRII